MLSMVTEMPPLWLPIALAEHGIRETPGPRSTARILEYERATNGGPSQRGDETPWCSSYANWVMQTAGYPGTRSKAARSWLTYGVGIQVPRLGAIAVCMRDDPENPDAAHVAFLVGIIGSQMLLLGGNQGNAVSIRPYPVTRLTALRWTLRDA
jgi:uncharacterized protein (TIGR02594 family)